MTLGESPAVARRRLRLALRKAREKSKLTQTDVANALDWSLSKVQRIESGDVAVSTTDLMALLSHFGVDDTNEKARLQSIAKISRRKGWWDEPKYRENLTPATLQLIAFESEATAIRVFHPTLLPGIVQTPEYAKHVLDFWEGDLSPEERAVRVYVRMRRRQELFERDDPPKYLLVLDESVLLREIDSPRVTADQLRELLRLIDSPNFTVRIIPLTKGAHLTMLNLFILVDLGDEENAILYREAQLVDEVDQAPDKIRLYRDRFETLWTTSLTPEASQQLIEERVKELASTT
jgi:transcriptional regulator with XRE-family HTH domain